MSRALLRGGAGLLCVLAWSTCFVAVRGTEGAAPPLLYAALRAGIASIVLFGLAAGARAVLPPPATVRWLVLLALSGTTLALAGMFESVGLAGTAIPAVLSESQVLLVAPFAALFFGAKLGPIRIVGIALGVLGVLVVAMAGVPGEVSGSGVGILLALTSAGGLATANLVMKHLAGKIRPLTAVAWQYGIGALGLFALSLAIEGSPRVEFGSRLVLGLLWLGIVLSAGATWLWFRLVQQGDLVVLNSLTLLTPVFAVGWAFLLFQERLPGSAGFGVLLTLFGVALVSAPRLFRRHRKPGDRAE